jgi:uncharacterized protein
MIENSGYLELQNAIFDRRLEKVINLVKSGKVHVHLCELPNGKTPIDTARELGYSEIEDWLLSDNSFSYTDEHFINAIDNHDITIVEEILKNKSVNVTQFVWPRGESPLERAAKSGNIDLVQILIDAGFDLNAGLSSPIASAASYRYPNIIKLLIESGAKVNDLMEGAVTPLMYASASGCIDCVRLLVEAGADVNLQDSDEDTALDKAVANKHQEVSVYLLPLTSPELRVYAETQMRQSP